MATENHIADDRKKVRLIDANALITYFEEQSCQTIISNKANVLVKTLPHNLAKIDAVEYTYNVDGNIEYYRCTRCNKYFEEQCDIATKDTEKESLYVLAALKCCIDLFQNFPTVDAAEVVHGQWDAVFEYEDFQYAHCSVCGKRSEYMTKFCPNCGAKMDGDGNGC